MSEKKLSDYAEILHMPYPDGVPLQRPRMALSERAAQFAPFAALTGLDDAVAEVARPTEDKPVLSEEQADEITRTLRLLAESKKTDNAVEIVYFVPDERKSGGALVTATGVFSRCDEYARAVLLADGRAIDIESVCEIRCDLSEDRQ